MKTGGFRMGKLWGGRFTKSTNKLVDEFTSSISFDHVFAEEDIEGSIAHVTMLAECKIITTDESDRIIEGLKIIEGKIRDGLVEFEVEAEDIHMNIEKMLIDEIGSLGGKLHTGRSRNDQIATDLHLYVKNKTYETINHITAVQETFIKQAESNIDVIMPGYTHLQRAQPILFSHHLLAYFWMLERDKQRLSDSLQRVSSSPLGAGALAGTTFPINRERTAELLGFQSVYPNSLDAVSDRDFILEFLSTASILMTHLSRLSEEFVIWSSEEFDFIELDDAFCTGSSIMPQKKNPDVPELIRGKTGRVNGNLIGLLTVLKSLPLAYNKDMQEDKEGLIDTVNTLDGSLTLLAPMIDTMHVKAENMYSEVSQDYSNATDIADYLVTKGLPFRQAHEIIGKIVLYAIQQKKNLLDLTLSEYLSFSKLFEKDIFEVLTPEHVVASRNSTGGTAVGQVREQLQKAKETIGYSNV